MNYIEKVKIRGFWGTRDFELSLNPDVTFLIGVNGSGKTTLINLIAASLSADFPTLDRLSFQTIEIAFKASVGQKQPSITVTKSPSKKLQFEKIAYEIKPSQSESPITFSLDEIEEQRFFRPRELQNRYVRERYARYATSIQELLSDIVRVSWLSIHRGSLPQRSHDERIFESTIDQKLSQLATDLLRYLSALAKQKDERMARFQEFIFTSLLDQMSPRELLQAADEVDIGKQKQVLLDIFEELHVTDQKVQTQIDEFFSDTEDIKRLGIHAAPVSSSSLLNLFSQVRINRVIDRWFQFKQEEEKIFSLRNRFIDIMNSMLQRKALKFDENNDILFVTTSEKRLTPQDLSSGEKQLFILLGEALLLRNEACVYIADEPELSLHVSWQEKIVSSVTTLNDKAQLIVATHSPDVVGKLQERAVDMEALLS